MPSCIVGPCTESEMYQKRSNQKTLKTIAPVEGSWRDQSLVPPASQWQWLSPLTSKSSFEVESSCRRLLRSGSGAWYGSNKSSE